MTHAVHERARYCGPMRTRKLWALGLAASIATGMVACKANTGVACVNLGAQWKVASKTSKEPATDEEIERGVDKCKEKLELESSSVRSCAVNCVDKPSFTAGAKQFTQTKKCIQSCDAGIHEQLFKSYGVFYWWSDD